MAYLNPAWLAEIGAAPAPAMFRVYAVAYPLRDGTRRPNRLWEHRTLNAAARRLASICSGKLRLRNEHAAFVMTPEGATLSLADIRKGN